MDTRMKTYSELPVNQRIAAYSFAKGMGYRGKQITVGLRFDVEVTGNGILVKSAEPIYPNSIPAPKPPAPKPSIKRPEGVTVFHTTDDSGRSNSKRPKQSNDCSVRAMAAAFDLDYDYTYDMLAAAGRKCAQGFGIMKWITKNSVDGVLLDRRVEYMHFPAVKGETRMNVEKFVREHQTGSYIIRVSKHVACVKDGRILDWMTVEDEGLRCVYTAFKISKL